MLVTKKNGSIERTELKWIDHIPFLSALIFWSIILAASRNMSKNINVGERVHPHSRKSFIRVARCASNKEFRTAISSFHEDISPVKVSWHLVSASQNRYGMSVRRSVVPHQSKIDVSHNEITASSVRVRPRTALLNCLPESISSTVHAAYTPESTSRSARPPSPQSLPIDVIKHDKVWNPPKRMI